MVRSHLIKGRNSFFMSFFYSPLLECRFMLILMKNDQACCYKQGRPLFQPPADPWTHRWTQSIRTCSPVTWKHVDMCHTYIQRNLVSPAAHWVSQTFPSDTWRFRDNRKTAAKLWHWSKHHQLSNTIYTNVKGNQFKTYDYDISNTQRTLFFAGKKIWIKWVLWWSSPRSYKFKFILFKVSMQWKFTLYIFQMHVIYLIVNISSMYVSFYLFI